MTFPQHSDERRHRARGRGWSLSLAAMATWAVTFSAVLVAVLGQPDPDTLYYFYGPMLAIVTLLGTPLTYALAWRRPRPFREVAFIALPVFAVLAAVVLSY